MKNFLSKINWFWVSLVLISAVFSLLISIFTHTPFLIILFMTIFCLGAGWSLFIALREIYWWITKTGDFK